MAKEDFIQYKPKEVSVRNLPKHFDHNDRKFIEKLMKENYKEGFLNAMNIAQPDNVRVICFKTNCKLITKLKT
jgi:pimeloyl-CoA synthetase